MKIVIVWVLSIIVIAIISLALRELLDEYTGIGELPSDQVAPSTGLRTLLLRSKQHAHRYGKWSFFARSSSSYLNFRDRMMKCEAGATGFCDELALSPPDFLLEQNGIDKASGIRKLILNLLHRFAVPHNPDVTFEPLDGGTRRRLLLEVLEFAGATRTR